MEEITGAQVHHGLGYMYRTLIRDLDIENHQDEMKQHLWNTVLRLVKEAEKLNLKWTYTDITMVIQDDRVASWNQGSWES